MSTLGTIVSTPHWALKFPISPTEFTVIHADQKEAWQCYHESLKKIGKEIGDTAPTSIPGRTSNRVVKRYRFLEDSSSTEVN